MQYNSIKSVLYNLKLFFISMLSIVLVRKVFTFFRKSFGNSVQKQGKKISG